MKISKKQVLIIVLCLEVIGLLAISSVIINSKTSIRTVHVEAQETDLTVTIDRDQFYYKNDTMKTYGYIHWVDLEGGNLILYGNTSDMFEIAFWDGLGNYTKNGDYTIFDDRIEVTVRTTQLFYQIKSKYYPDYFLDTNFIVIFDTFWAQFSYLTPEGEERYAPVNYHNRQILPEGAGIVSYAPCEGAAIVKQGNSFGVVWEYEQRAMDPFHEPFPYEITYNFDPIYLQFTEQMYSSQQQQQEIEQINSLLDLLQVYFRIIAFFAIIISLIAAFFGYLRAKRKFKAKLNEARSMPKKMLKDIEAEIEPRKRVSSLFNVMFIVLLLSSLTQINNITVTKTDDGNTIINEHKVGFENISLMDTSRNINYSTVIDLGRDGIAIETVVMELPFTVENFTVWADTENVLDFRAYQESGAPISSQKFADRYLITNVPGYIRYEIIRPYEYCNNTNILVYIDYFWLLFYDYDLQDYSKANIRYTVIAPEGAILYSASPESLLTLSKTPEGRRKVTFDDFNREIDPYHDLFSSQVTFSYIDVLDAIENQSARFEHFRVETQLNQEQIAALTRNLIFISLLGLIAPILAFLLTYFIMRRRMLRKIKEEEQKYEMLISVEEIQLKAMNQAQKIDINEEPWKAMLGEYWELLAYLSRLTPVNLLGLKEELHEKTIRKYIPSFLISETLEVLSTGKGISENWLNNEQIYYNKQQARDYIESVMKLIEKMEKWRKEQK